MKNLPATNSRHSEKDADEKRDNRLRRSKVKDVVNITLLILSSSLILWVLWSLFSNPIQGPRALAYLILIPAAAVAFNRAFAILQRFIASRRLRLSIGIIKWVGTLLFPIFLIPKVEAYVQKRTIEVYDNELSPLIEYIENYQRNNGTFPNDISKPLSDIKFKLVNNFAYHAGEQNYLITAHVSAGDIDGATIFYDPLPQKWLRFHNDIYSHYQRNREDLNSQPASGSDEIIRRYETIQNKTRYVQAYRK